MDQGQGLLKEDVHGHLREEDLEDAADFHQDALLFVVVLVVDHAVHRQDVVEVHPGEQVNEIIFISNKLINLQSLKSNSFTQLSHISY